MSGKQGEAGANALDNFRDERTEANKKRLRKALKRFRNNRIPLVIKELAEEADLSVSSLNRSPYKEIVKEYEEEEKVLLSPDAKQEVAELIRENRRLKEELKTLQEEYKRLKKEIAYIKELFP